MTQQELNEQLNTISSIDVKIVEAPPKPALQLILTKNTWGLLQVSPNNPTVRALVQAELKRPIPDEHNTLDKILAWFDGISAEFTPPKPKAPTQSFIYDVRYDKQRCGTCKYSDSVTFNGNFKVNPGRIAGIVADSESIEEAANALSDFMVEDVENWAGTSRQRYSDIEIDHDATDWDECNIEAESLELPLENWLKTNMPEEWERLNR